MTTSSEDALVEKVVDVLCQLLQALRDRGSIADYSFRASVGERDGVVSSSEACSLVREAADKLHALASGGSEAEAVDDAPTPPPHFHPNLVQINANKAEMNRRIAAFARRKRMEVDELNVQEFCHRPCMEAATDSCARVDAVVVKRSVGKSHIKVSQVVNHWGPQTEGSWNPPSTNDTTRPISFSKGTEKRGKTLPSEANTNVDERLSNMETHLRLKTDPSVSKDIYGRLKDLEDRILFLEGMSPDYFTFSPRKLHKQVNPQSSLNKRKHGDVQGDLSVEDIDARIRHLRNNLRMKQEQKSLTRET